MPPKHSDTRPGDKLLALYKRLPRLALTLGEHAAPGVPIGFHTKGDIDDSITLTTTSEKELNTWSTNFRHVLRIWPKYHRCGKGHDVSYVKSGKFD